MSSASAPSKYLLKNNRISIMISLVFQGITAFSITLVSLVILSKIAPRLGLLDKPSSRKKHKGEVPLVGGIALFIALSMGGIIWGTNEQISLKANGQDALWVFLSAGGLLILVGILDDRSKLNVSIRVITEIIIALIVIEGLDLNLRNLGALVGDEPIIMPTSIAYLFTVIAIFGLINAFNMLDGMDGLLASLVLITIINFHIFISTKPGFVSVYVAGSLLAFLTSNLSLSRLVPRTFLGDAGSRLLGFIVVCLLLASASGQLGETKFIQPVTALYIASLPLFDMTFTVLRRVARGTSPFRPDRSHIHHLLQDLGFSDVSALLIILGFGTLFPLFGLQLSITGASEQFQFFIFLFCFAVYCFGMNRAWKTADRRSC